MHSQIVKKFKIYYIKIQIIIDYINNLVEFLYTYFHFILI